MSWGRSGSVGLVLVFAAALGSVAAAEEPVTWRMNSLLFLKVFGEAGMRFADTVRVISGGSIDIEFNDRLVFDADAFAAMEEGLVDAVWGSAGHHHREDPALAIFTGFPFITDMGDFSAWMRHGGGQDHLNEIYARHGLYSIYCGILPPESGGWFREPIDQPGDLDGLRMRVFGLGGRVMRKLGVLTYEMPAAEVVPALENRTLDAAEFSLTSIDVELGLQDAARHLYMPGWQQPVTTLEFLLPAKTYGLLSDRQKLTLQTACGDNIVWTAARFTADEIETLASLRTAGVEIHLWPEDILEALEGAWTEVIAEETAADPVLAAAWVDYLRFREDHRSYRELAFPD